MKRWISILVGCCVCCGYAHHSFIHDVSTKYFPPDKCIALIGDENAHVQISNFPHYLISSGRTFNPSLIKHPMEAGCAGFVLHVVNISSILNTILLSTRYSVQRQNHKYIAVQENEQQTPENILSLPQLKVLPDFIFAQKHNSTYKLWTHKFVGNSENEQSSPILINEWQNGNFKYEGLGFKSKIANLQGRIVKVATFNYSPYSIIDSGGLDGTEGRLAVELSKELNFTLQIVTDDHEWGEIREDATGNGILGAVSEDRADMGLGALYTWYYEYQFLDFSVPYIRTGITCLAPRPALLSGWRAPALPFSWRVWFSVACSLAFAILIICVCANVQTWASHYFYGTPASHFVQKLCKPTECVLLILSMSVLAPPPVLPNSASALKHCINWFLIQCLLLATCYGSSLVSFMTVPRYAKPVDTAADIAKTGLHWAATHDAWAFSLREATDPVHQQVYKLFLKFSEQELNAVAAASRKHAFSVERLPAGNFAVGDYLAKDEVLSKLRLMSEDLYWEMVVTMVRKGSPYLRSLNRLIHRLSASGIMLYWEGEVSRKYLSARHQIAIKNSQSSSHVVNAPTILKISHIQGVFMILGIGLALSSIQFVIEIFSIKSNMQAAY